MMQPNRYLTIIANQITVGNNVSIGWAMVNKPRPSKPEKPSTPSTPGQETNWMQATGGGRGTNGTIGGPGPDGDPGPEIEIWTLNMQGSPDVVVRGQDGFEGGSGGDGGNGGDGAKGKNFKVDLLGFCTNGPGNGGDGGKGGDGGDGGPGGAGGDGGRFSLYAPQSVIDRYTDGFYIDGTGGRGGKGGFPGRGGNGGQGGPRGDNRIQHPCSTNFGQNGQRGHDGAPGQPGRDGPDGRNQDRAFRLQAINQNDFLIALSKPAIETVSPNEVKEGDTVIVNGKRFAQTDVILLNDVQCRTTVSSDTLLTFVVGKVSGGRRQPVQVKQVDGTLSNRGSLNVLPTLSHAESNTLRSDSIPPAHFKPSTMVTLIGTGFAQNANVRVLDNYISGSDVEYIDSNTLRFRLKRPRSTPRNPDGEPVDVQLILADGSFSNLISVVLETYRILVFGDSIQWGQGLRDNLKFSAIVERAVSERGGNVSVYRDVYAHSGAIIGVGNTDTPLSLGGEVPASHPTILQQVSAFTGDKDKVDLILLDGGINDIGVEIIVNPMEISDLSQKAYKYCYQDMKLLLSEVTHRYPKAKVIVTGYGQIVSDDSALSMLPKLLIGVGIPLAVLRPEFMVGGVLAAAAQRIMVDRCKTFAEHSAVETRKAINEVNSDLEREGGSPRVFFALPNFGPRNAIFAPDTWLWGVKPPLLPEDEERSGGVASERASACSAAARHAPPYCYIASIGHPNVAGAQAYAQRILDLL